MPATRRIGCTGDGDMVYENLIYADELPVTELPPPELPQKPPGPPKNRLLRRQCLAAGILCALVLTVPTWWPSGAEHIRHLLVAREVGPLEAAAQTFVRDVSEGVPLGQAVATFCQSSGEPPCPASE